MKSLKILMGKCTKASGTAVSLDRVLGKYLPFSNLKYDCQVFCRRNTSAGLINADLDEVIDLIINAVNSCILHDSELIIETSDIPSENKTLVEIKCLNGRHFVNLTFDKFVGIPKDVISDSNISAILPVINTAVNCLEKAGVIFAPELFTDNKNRCSFRLCRKTKMAKNVHQMFVFD